MNTKKFGVPEIYGHDYDLVAGNKWNPNPRQVVAALPKLPLQPDPAWPEHRAHLSADEKLLLRAGLDFRFSFDLAIPPVHQLAEYAGVSYHHALRIVRYLERQGLLKIKEAGRALALSVAPLIARVRELLKKKRKEDAFTAPPEPAPKPKPAPPPEPDPLPPAAEVEEDEDELDEEIAAKMAEQEEWQAIMNSTPRRSPQHEEARRKWQDLSRWLVAHAPLLVAALGGG